LISPIIYAPPAELDSSIEWKGTKVGFLHHALFKEGRNFPIAIFVIAVEGSLFYMINNIYVSHAGSAEYKRSSTLILE